jgi:hypothetical protein
VTQFRALPLLYDAEKKKAIEEDLTIALFLWTLESKREKGGGILSKKPPEKFASFSIVWWPLLLVNYRNTTMIFDGFGIASSEIKYGISPNLTLLLNNLHADSWQHKSDMYADCLNRHSDELEGARRKNRYLVKGWIGEIATITEINNLFQASDLQNSKSGFIAQII